ncbi:MAG TPA: ABC transporter substrate-binding protein [Actinomycetes bacterium]|nr:ABC transporter substrate-binding protein [Actinomycetes bacterium]
MAACKNDEESGGGTSGGGAQGRAIRLGYVSPQTGPLAGFGEADNFILEGVRTALKDGLQIGGTAHAVEILVKDSQSDPNRAATVAGDLITGSEVDLILATGTPETTNPVADQAEANGVPAITSVAPWQPYFFGRKGDPEKPFKWTYHFFWGLEDIIQVFTNLWGEVPTNKVVGALWPNDGDGNAWGDPKQGFPPALEEAGYKVVDPGRYQNQTDDFSSQISRFKSANVEIVTGVPIPPDFTTFWKQAAQQGFRPKIASVGKALLFPSSVDALGDLGDGVSTEVWWTPSHPFTSSLTQASAKQLADDYTKSTGKPWTQPIGFVHALFEVAADALKRAGGVDDKQAIADAIKATKLDTIVGPLDWSSGPVPNVAKTPLVGGQWRQGSGGAYELVIVNNKTAPQIPAAGELEPIAAS